MKVIVAGAGIAGLSVARALQLKGHECEVIEQSSEPRLAGMGIFLLGNATRALQQLGALGPIETSARVIRDQRIFSANGRLLHTLSAEDFWTDCGPCLAMPRSLLIQTLLSSLGDTRVTYGKAVIDVEETEIGPKAHFSDGSFAHCDLVIAADGINSRLRNISGGVRPRPLGTTCWRIITENRVGTDGWTAMLGRGRTLLAIPISDSKVYLYADCRSADVRGHTVSDLKKLFKDFRGPLGSLVAHLETPAEMHFGELQEVPEFTATRSGLVLIGDAAHACSPSMAQGAGMALEDALVLAEAISSGGDAGSVTYKFLQQRRERVSWVRKQARARDAVRSLPPGLRNFILRNLGDALYSRSYSTLRGSIF